MPYSALADGRANAGRRAKAVKEEFDGGVDHAILVERVQLFEFHSAAPKLPTEHDRLQLPFERLTFDR